MKYESSIIAAFKSKKAKEQMARGIIVSFLGMFVMACSGCGGGGGGSGSSLPAQTQTATPAPVAPSGTIITPSTPIIYSDGRPAASFRLPVVDQGIVLKHGDAADPLGARDAFVYQSGDTYYMNYDDTGPAGWRAMLATSKDLMHWTKVGPVLQLGASTDDDSGSASYGTTYFDGQAWHMFYLGAKNTSGAPDYVPNGPYLTMKASSSSPSGPWIKQPTIVPFRPVSGTYYSGYASPGQTVKSGSQYLQFFSAYNDKGLRTLGIARTADLNSAWSVDANPIVPPTEQIENSSFYYQVSTQTWFLFTNHVGIRADGLEYTDAIWVYWTKDPNQWSASNKAIVLDGSNCSWSKKIIGLPAVVPAGDKLAIIYDGLQGDTIPNGADSHMRRDIGLAWVQLPIRTPN